MAPADTIEARPTGRTAGWETVRAFLVFGVLLASLGAVALQVAVRDMSRLVHVHRMNLGREEGSRLSEAIVAVGRDGSTLDYSRIRATRGALEAIIRERLIQRPYLRFVELRDRFGAPVFAVAREGGTVGPVSLGHGAGRTAGVAVLTIRFRRGIQDEGELRLGISEDAIAREVEDLRRSLRVKVAVAAVLGVAILVVGLFYVLHLIRKNRRLEQSKLAAERAAYKGLLASGLAHEIRNPLNAMNMNLQMLEEELAGLPGLDGRDHAELLGSTKSEIKRLERLVSSFLQYARPSPARLERRDLNEVVRETVTFLQADFRQSSVELATQLEAVSPEVDIDESKIKQALMNVLVNARQALKSGGRVVVRTHAGVGGEAVIEVQDDGPGMPGEVAARIFEPFYSGKAGGTGLGLPIAKLMVEQHGGTVEVASEPGRGTTFRIRLPRRPAAASNRETAADAP